VPSVRRHLCVSTSNRDEAGEHNVLSKGPREREGEESERTAQCKKSHKLQITTRINSGDQARAQMDPEWCSSSSPFALDEESGPSAGATLFPSLISIEEYNLSSIPPKCVLISDGAFI